LLSQWFYTQRLDGELGGKDKASRNLIRLWVLAERLLIPSLQNLAIDTIEIFRRKHNAIWTDMFKYVWGNTAANSPLRRLFIQQCVWNLSKEGFSSSRIHFTTDMLVELCSEFREITLKQTAPPRNMANFHVKET
jgi:hypothetical protein